jgi:hypothetical protein
MARRSEVADPTARLDVVLRDEPGGLQVLWRLTGVALQAGEPLARIPLSIAGAPTIAWEAAGVAARDDAGPLRLSDSVLAGTADGDERVWVADRATLGGIELEYLARPIDAEPLAATPPLELRGEGGGLSGAIKCFLLLPGGPQNVAFGLRWEQPADPGQAWMAVTSLGEAVGGAVLAGVGLELLGDTFVMCGDLAGRHRRDGQMETWWLTPPGFDVVDFSDQLGTTYRVMSEAFEAPAHPFRVFLRSHPHRGLNASAHPASFVMAVNPANPLAASKIYETLAHELVHEWLHLDGTDEEVRWFSEGSADYYSLELPRRAGILDEDSFLDAVNAEARTAYANPRRGLTMHQAEPLFFEDFLAHWLPYARGMFYLADLDGRLREACTGSVDDVVREVTRRRRDGEWIGIDQWCALVDRMLPGTERAALDAMVFTGDGRPGPGTLGPRFELTEAEVPVLDAGFDPTTFITRRVTGLVPDGPADRAGLREGDAVDLPSFTEASALGPDDVLTIGVTREGHTGRVEIALNGHTVPVPQWRRSQVHDS